ncbi:MAG: redoxin domain-containing protein [Candidatus Shikimatogenerans bostrichidophilus]|nr:MAG: redoxin domain-containing protein [Candidatus Shikimatogenerans bostrichidophilus]
MKKNLIGKKAINFLINGVKKKKKINNFNLKKFFNKKYILLFFLPNILRFFCPKELNNLQKKIKEFNYRNVKIIIITTKNVDYYYNLLKIKKRNGGIKGIKFTILSDKKKKIFFYYKLLSGNIIIYNNNLIIKNKKKIKFYKGFFFIDKLGIIRYNLIKKLNFKIKIYKILNKIDKWQYYEKYNINFNFFFKKKIK